MTVSNWVYFWIGMLLFMPLTYFLFDRTDFVLNSQQAVATVEQVSARNARCGKRGRRACTKFEATLKYQVSGTDYRIDVNAGRTGGHNQSVEFANYRSWDQVGLVYDSRRPQLACLDTTWAIWHVPIILVLVQIALFIASMNDRNRPGIELEDRRTRIRRDREFQQRQTARRSR